MKTLAMPRKFKPDSALPFATVALLAAALAAAMTFALQPAEAADAPAAAASAVKPALTVALTPVKAESWPQLLSATGSLAAWREVQVGSELGGQRIQQVSVELGQRVRKGQLLAQLQSAGVAADLAASRAGLLEAEATAREAVSTAARLKILAGTDAVSAQQLEQAQAAAAGAEARAAAAKARVQADELRLSYTRIVAPVDGIVSSKEAVEGALPQAGQLLFSLIRDGRLEWRAEVPASELAQLQAGQKVRVLPAGGTQPLEGKVRVVAPTVDATTRLGRVLVDLSGSPAAARAGMFARGDFVLGDANVLTVPQTALLLRDGFAFVFKLEGSKVRQVKVELGRRQGDRVEIRHGLKATDKVVAQGVGFLADGDTVRVAQ